MAKCVLCGANGAEYPVFKDDERKECLCGGCRRDVARLYELAAAGGDEYEAYKKEFLEDYYGNAFASALVMNSEKQPEPEPDQPVGAWVPSYVGGGAAAPRGADRFFDDDPDPAPEKSGGFLSGLFTDVPRKMQTLLRVFYYIEAAACLLGGLITTIVLLVNEEGIAALIAFASTVFAPFVLWVAMAPLYCFFGIADDVSAMRKGKKGK
ncbi:MAG: hypothetical protein IK104_11595 [Clostridia bacterium]|nr:hypothetical protein [Clostridia bacterium]